MMKLPPKISLGTIRQMQTVGIIATLEHAIDHLYLTFTPSTIDAIVLIRKAQSKCKQRMVGGTQ